MKKFYNKKSYVSFSLVVRGIFLRSFSASCPSRGTASRFFNIVSVPSISRRGIFPNFFIQNTIPLLQDPGVRDNLLLEPVVSYKVSGSAHIITTQLSSDANFIGLYLARPAVTPSPSYNRVVRWTADSSNTPNNLEGMHRAPNHMVFVSSNTPESPSMSGYVLTSSSTYSTPLGSHNTPTWPAHSSPLINFRTGVSQNYVPIIQGMRTGSVRTSGKVVNMFNAILSALSPEELINIESTLAAENNTRANIMLQHNNLPLLDPHEILVRWVFDIDFFTSTIQSSTLRANVQEALLEHRASREEDHHNNVFVHHTL